MQITVLASGSDGNATVVDTAHCRILVDAGISVKKIRTLSRAARLEPRTVRAVLVTHEHGDHAAYLASICEYYGCSAYADSSVHDNIQHKHGVSCLSAPFLDIAAPGTAIDFLPAEHADGVAGVSIVADGKRLIYMTDVGFIPLSVRTAQRTSFLLIESNYDAAMLPDSGYDPQLQMRIKRDHLSNGQVRQLLGYEGFDKSSLEDVLLLHISKHSNTPDRAEEIARLAGINAPIRAWRGVPVSAGESVAASA